MDVLGRRLSTGDLVTGIAAIVAVIATFLPWYSVSTSCSGCGIYGGSGSASESGFHSWGILFFLAALVILVFFAIRTFASTQVALPALPLEDWLLYLIAAIVAAVGALLYWLLEVNGNATGSYSGFGYSVSAGLGFGWFIAIIAAAAMIVGAVLKKADPQPAVAPRAAAAPPAPMGYAAPPVAPPAAPGMPQQAAPAPAPPAAPPMAQPPVAPPPPPAPPADPNQPPAPPQ